MSIIKVVVPSNGVEKEQATTRAFTYGLFKDDPFKRQNYNQFLHIKMVKGYSGVWEQPVGFYMDSTGAANRIRCGQELEPDAHYWVGIENMIGSVALRGSTKWFDMACVIVRHKSGLESISISTGIEFPEAVVREAEKIGFDTTTVGSLIAKHYGCDGKNPHLFLTSFLLGRVEILEQAVTAALGQLIFQMKLAGVNYL